MALMSRVRTQFQYNCPTTLTQNPTGDQQLLTKIVSAHVVTAPYLVFLCPQSFERLHVFVYFHVGDAWTSHTRAFSCFSDPRTVYQAYGQKDTPFQRAKHQNNRALHNPATTPLENSPQDENYILLKRYCPYLLHHVSKANNLNTRNPKNAPS